MNDEMIYRRSVIAFVVTKEKSCGFQYIYQYPITVYSDGDSDDIELHEEEEVVSVVPAQLGTFAVYGIMPGDSNDELLGYEYPGAYNPDWNERYDEMLKSKTKMKK